MFGIKGSLADPVTKKLYYNDTKNELENLLEVNLELSENINFNNFKNKKLKHLLNDLLQLNPNNRPNDDNILGYSFFKSKHKTITYKNNKLNILRSINFYETVHG